MKLLALCGFLFVCLLCLNAFTAEGMNFKRSPMETRKYRKSRPQPAHLRVPGPLPQLK